MSKIIEFTKPTKERVQTMDSLIRSGKMGARFALPQMDAATAGGLAFLVGELEKVDTALMEPLTSVTWMRDIVAKTGGGFVNLVSAYAVSYGTTGADEESLIYNGATDIATAQADLTKDLWKTVTFAMNMQIGYLDQEALRQIPRSINEIYDNGIKLNWNKLLDKSTYYGLSKINTHGLVNNPNVVTSTVAAGASTKTTWKDKTPVEILADVNAVLAAQWEAVGYDTSAMANHILVDPVNFGYIATTPVTEAGTESILSYIKRNCLAAAQQVDLEFVPCRQCKGAGASSANRLVVYRNDESKIDFDITMPLGRVMTSVDAGKLAYLTSYAGQFSEVKFKYPQTVRYADGV
ncbi:DUF2184 domain-containing protein [Anaerotruncus sp. AF02-27]|uniref:DUF2184 domain-containing protein n=1 Tax=Anaerotruncus sp. AF02-27 TaxID=2292191 RepID=UPI000E52EFB3|nr:DUF2184 domain-containing protein [Anaerotruncus sp. AF02-27]RGX53184.1 DUF2184 domain-containing protein [Anaerotruncus sp. AF02-27]